MSPRERKWVSSSRVPQMRDRGSGSTLVKVVTPQLSYHPLASPSDMSEPTYHQKMTLQQVKQVLDRADRLRLSLADKKGHAFSWIARDDDGHDQFYTIRNVKEPEALQDAIVSCFVWLWGLKEYFLEYCRGARKPTQIVEDYIEADSRLQLCMDIANREKHGTLKRSRSGKFPKLGKVHYSIPRAAISKLTIGQFNVGIDISDPTLVEISLPVYDQAHAEIANAVELLDHAISRWQHFMSSLAAD
jgi:hypothetical protein